MVYIEGKYTYDGRHIYVGYEEKEFLEENKESEKCSPLFNFETCKMIMKQVNRDVPGFTIRYNPGYSCFDMFDQDGLEFNSWFRRYNGIYRIEIPNRPWRRLEMEDEG